jgi:glutathione S-transferase
VITLYDNPFSPFARKVRMALKFKGLSYRSVDALALDQLEDLERVNARAEVPVLVDGGVTVAESADIVAYLEDRYPTPALFPGSPELRARARHWQRIADRVLDAVVHDVSLWTWPTHSRQDQPPPGLVEAARRDLAAVLAQLEQVLEDGSYICGELSVADLAVFPHTSSLKPLGIVLGEGSLPRVSAWFLRMRAQPVVRADLAYVKRAAAEKFVENPSPYEGEKVIWRGDRIEWLLCNGFDAWWAAERASGRAVVPSSLEKVPGSLAPH